jgi:hypothetical protein
VPSDVRLQTRGSNALSLPEQAARWSALVDIEGMGYSGRLKILLHSGRPVLLQDRPWREWWWDHLLPMKHYIPVQRDLSDLVERARWVQDHPNEAAQIGRAGQKLAQRLLTRTSAVNEWARILWLAAQTRHNPWTSPDLQEALTPVMRELNVRL